MRNAKALVLLVLAILFGLGAALYAVRWVAQRGNLSSKVAVAAIDIELGSRINPQMVNVVDWPNGSVPPGAFTDVKDLQDRVLKVGVLRGDAIVERKLAPAGTSGGLSAVIAEGKRAMTVRVNDVVGVAGFALPGNYVDVMVNMQQEQNRQDSISRLVLDKVLVLAVAQEASRDDLKPKVVNAVTLELSPGDAEKLDLARSVGTLSLVLRNQLDGEKLATAGVTRAQLLGLKEVVAKATPAPAPRHRPAPALVPAPRDCVEVISNASSSTQCF